MRIVWTELAVQDLLVIRRYIADRNPAAARSVASRILHAVELLPLQPHLGIPTHRTDVRRLVIAGTVYSIPYRVTGETIEILEVFDGRRRAPRTALGSDPS
jgi:toxin ParE1/3/4